jgi:voltage-gated potassium channel Kch
VVTLSMAPTPFRMILAGRLASRRLPVDVKLDDPGLAEQASVIIVGHGRFGQTVGQIMQAAGLSITIIDIKPEQIGLSGEFGRKVFYGDGTRIDLLHRAGADDADAILFCIDDRQLDAESLIPVRETFPDARLFVRAFDRRQMLELMPAEDVSIVREVFESSVHMADEALAQLEVKATIRKKAVAEFRRRDLERLKAQFNTGSLRAGSRHSFGVTDSDDFYLDEG